MTSGPTILPLDFSSVLPAIAFFVQSTNSSIYRNAPAFLFSYRLSHPLAIFLVDGFAPWVFFMIYDWFWWFLQEEGGNWLCHVLCSFWGLSCFVSVFFPCLVPSSLSLSVCFSFCSPLFASLSHAFVFWSSQPRFSRFTAASFSGQLCGTWFSFHFYLPL